MASISRDEVLKIAKISNISVHEDEIDTLTQQLADVLTYAQRVTQFDRDVPENALLPINVMREDKVCSLPIEPILSQAPEREGNFFVVPIIIEHS